eukprot:138466-Amphidinium_carterae.1
MRSETVRGLVAHRRAQEQLRPHEEGRLSGLPLLIVEFCIDGLLIQPFDRHHVLHSFVVYLDPSAK